MLLFGRRRGAAPPSAAPPLDPPAQTKIEKKVKAKKPARDWTAAALNVLSIPILLAVAAAGAWNSFDAQSSAARPYLGHLADLFPVTVDGLILGATLRYIAGVRRGRIYRGYQYIAYAGIAATVLFNVIAAGSPAGIPWHAWYPIAVAALVHFAGKEAMGAYQESTGDELRTGIPPVLWVVDFGFTRQIWLRMLRTDDNFEAAQRWVGMVDAAHRVLGMNLDGPGSYRAHHLIMRHVRTGTIPPEAVLRASSGTPAEIVSDLLTEALTGRPALPASPSRRRRSLPPPVDPPRSSTDTDPESAAPVPPPDPEPAGPVDPPPPDPDPADPSADDPADDLGTGYGPGQLSKDRDAAYVAWATAQRSGTAWTGKQLGHVLGIHEGSARKVSAEWQRNPPATVKTDGKVVALRR